MSAPSTACDLCGLPVLGRPIHDRERDFCCEGCRRVWTSADDAGLSGLLAAPGERRSRDADASARKAAAAAAVGARRETLRIDGMWCSSCGLVLEDALMALVGVLDAETSYAASLARVTWDPDRTSLEDVIARISLLGYSATPARDASGTRGDTEDLFLRLFVGVTMGMWVMWPTFFVLWPAFAHGDFAEPVQAYELFTGLLSLVVLAYAGWPFLAGAWRAARVGRATMDTLVVLGTWTAWLYSAWTAATLSAPTYFESAAMITTIVLLGRWLESLGTRDAAESLARLAQGAEAEAWLVQAGDHPAAAGNDPHAADAVRVAVDALAAGDMIAVRAGERVPADGIVVSGTAEIDASRLTGEPLPVGVGPGDEVWAGAIDLEDVLLVRVTRVGTETLAGRLALIAEDAAFAKSHAQRVADAVAAVFVPVVIAIAAATLLIGLVSGAGAPESVSRAVAVLVVSCPCALALATPLAVVNAMAAGSRRGLLVRGGPALERAGRIATVAFDKTGTLTAGSPSVTGFIPAETGPAEQASLLGVAAALEGSDPHPVAAALREAAVAAGAVAPTQAGAVERHPGRGLTAPLENGTATIGNERLLAERGVELPPGFAYRALEARRRGALVVWVAHDAALLGGVVLADEARPEAAEAVERLRAMGVRTAVVSGDARATTEAVAERLGIDEVHAEVLPHEKERVVRDLARSGPLAFVGDGLNDAAALAAADLAVAVGGGADVAVISADVVLLGESISVSEHLAEHSAVSPLASVPTLVHLAVATRRVISQNLAWAFTYNLVAIPLAVTGRLSPIAAAAAMAVSSIAVVANSWRLRLAGRR